MLQPAELPCSPGSTPGDSAVHPLARAIILRGASGVVDTSRRDKVVERVAPSATPEYGWRVASSERGDRSACAASAAIGQRVNWRSDVSSSKPY